MTWWERWAFNTLHCVVAASGTAYFYMKVVLTPDDPFAVINHPWQPTMLALHVLAAPIFIAFFGMVFRSHTVRKLGSASPANRRSGWTSLGSFAAMALSGYALQIAADPRWIAALVWIHVGTSLLFLVGYGLHLVIGWRLRSPLEQRMSGRDRLPGPARARP